MDAGRGSNIFPMPQIPALLFPPPPPPLPSSYSLSSTSRHHEPSITNFPILVLTVLGILTTSLLLLAYYVFVIRCCLKWHRGSPSDSAGHVTRHGRRRHATAAASGGARGAGGLVGVCEPRLEQACRHAANQTQAAVVSRAGGASSSSLPVSGAAPTDARGLEEAIIQALPAFRYRKAVKNAAADSGAPTSECAVCLGEFEDEERVRMLPACLHVFHVGCIDTWLQGNANCPLCRAAITGHFLVPPLDELPRPNEVAIQVVPITEGDEAMRAQQQQASIAMTSYESAGDRNTATDQQVRSGMRKNSNAWRDIDINTKADECIAQRKDRDVLPLRRSYSMGEMGGGEVHLHIHNILQRNSRFHGDDGDSSTSTSSSSV
ncbi:unnamed protein product [Urochloa decumbens]|uniref:RING-type E3 ubiquitin transferase n=1 Tax=Urochloa decumbens TaxID=240449 RepID=A0ABC9EI20_9POAL